MTKEEWTARGYRYEGRFYQLDDGSFNFYAEWWSESDGRGKLIKQRKFLRISFEEMVEQLAYPAHLIPRP